MAGDKQPDRPDRPDNPDHTRHDPDGHTRRRYLIAATKIRPEDRDVSGPVLRGPHAHYRDIMSSSDDDTVELGAPVAYDAWLTDDEADAFRAASNVRAVDLDGSVPEAFVVIPPAATLAWMNASLTQQGTLNGSGVKVAVLDGGTTAAVRAQCSWTVAAERVFTAGAAQVEGTHGCLVTPEAIPPAGQLVECMIATIGGGSADWSSMAAAIVWASDQGVKVCNISYGGLGPAFYPPQAVKDACGYARDRLVQVCISAGNDGAAGISSPAILTREYPNVHAIGAVDKTTNALATFSNYDPDLSGLAPGVNEPSLNTDGTPATWSGTSCSSPLAAQLIALLCTGGTYNPQQVANALRGSARDLGLGVNVQGRGAWSLSHAKTLLATAQPGGLMKAHANVLQVIPPSAYTRLKFHVTDQTNANVTINANRDVLSAVTAGDYLIKVTSRWVGHTEGPGDRFAAIGPNIPWNSPGGKTWSQWSSEGDDTGLGFTLVAVEPLPAGQQFCAWMWQSAPYGWGVDWTIAHADNWCTNLTVRKL